jgi:hypothetical protein
MFRPGLASRRALLPQILLAEPPCWHAVEEFTSDAMAAVGGYPASNCT